MLHTKVTKYIAVITTVLFVIC